jgi:hypothetical protein
MISDTIMSMFRKKNIIKFESYYKEYPNIMIPSRTMVPDWYKNQKPDQGISKSFKKCVPFLEAITCGYLVKLPMDVYIEQRDNVPFVVWSNFEEGKDLIGYKLNDSIDNIPAPEGFHKNTFYWKFPVSFQLPVGHSALFTQPLNRFDSPFLCFSVVIDGGYTLPPGANVPFYIRENFEGLIPQGTPIAQIIPFKNGSWSAQDSKGIVEQGKGDKIKSSLVFGGWYKKTFWTRKKYD